MTPRIKAAVIETVYLLEQELAHTPNRQNRETVTSCRNILFFLIGTKQLPKAKEWLEKNQ